VLIFVLPGVCEATVWRGLVNRKRTLNVLFYYCKLHAAPVSTDQTKAPHHSRASFDARCFKCAASFASLARRTKYGNLRGAST
jgi:hypothetical protein